MVARIRGPLAGLALVLVCRAVLGSPSPALAIEESDRLWLVAERAFADGLSPLALRLLERFVDRFPGDGRIPEATLLLGKARLAQGELSPALEAFRKAETFTPPPGKAEEARFWEAETLFRMKRFPEARGAYERLLADNAASPLAPDALYGLGWAQFEMNQRDAAVTSFRQLIEAFPDHPTVPAATVQLGRLLVDLKRFEAAVALLKPFAVRYPDHRLVAEARYLLGLAQVSGGHATEGLAELRAVIAAYPGHDMAARARRVVVDTLVREGKKSELAQEYRTLMDQSPRTAEGLYDAGVIAARLGRSRDADAAWLALKSEFADHPLTGRAALDRAHAAFGRGDYKDAAALSRVAAKSPEAAVRAQGLLLVGESEVKLKHFGPAYQAFQGAVEAGGQDPSLRFRALAGSGLALEEQRQWSQAARYYEQVAAESPDKELRAWAKSRRAAVAANLKPAPKTRPKGQQAPKP